MITGSNIFSECIGRFIGNGIVLSIFILAYQFFVGLAQINWHFVLMFLVVWVLIFAPLRLIFKEIPSVREWIRKEYAE